MTALTTPPLSDTLAWLLGRPVSPEDGLPEDELAAASHRLGGPVPPALHAYYAAVGRRADLMAGFQRFAPPQDWECLGDKLLFLEENQGVCWWATDARQRVWQTTDLDSPDWFEEAVGLEAFLHTVSYYQMAQGGYPFCGMRTCGAFSTPGELASLLDALRARPVVDMAGLRIFTVGPQALVWYLHSEGELAEPGVFLSVLDALRFDALCAQWDFDDLG
ncbi:hypothetical protein KW843_09270 [Acidovorax sp. sif1233]|uniref:hypothetical protein n=1 Tax=Acidovorax sp. sif1233 TaxID=2854792 RepID=UPI001C478F24|nr:hypothetical protein [Acidovorax sp. sif1233]MBV7454657.1 hypothetical protein [Acidovorax sp. sif1233]